MTIRMVATMAWGWATLVVAAPLSSQAPAPAPRDTSFLLSTDDAGRTPSPFIGNGRIGVVVPALGIGPSFSFMSGLYENAPSDIPRIVAIPAWNALQVSNGSHWLDTTAVEKGEIDAYRQGPDMSTGTARTSYHWVNSGRRMSVRVQAFASRADPDLVALRLDLAPQYTGRLGVRFAIQGQPAPKRLALATLEKADPAWQPGDIWYPGQMVFRSREATPVSNGARLSISSVPQGRPSLLAQAMEVRWPRALANPKVRTIASGDTALVEVTFEATRGRNYTFIQVTSARAAEAERELITRTAASAGGERTPRAPASAQAASTRGFRALALANAQAWHRRWETDIHVEGDPA